MTNSNFLQSESWNTFQKADGKKTISREIAGEKTLGIIEHGQFANRLYFANLQMRREKLPRKTSWILFALSQPIRAFLVKFCVKTVFAKARDLFSHQPLLFQIFPGRKMTFAADFRKVREDMRKSATRLEFPIL